MALPTYIPISDAARKYGYKVAELRKMAESGKIDAVQLPDGDVVVSENRLGIPEIANEAELEEYKDQHYADLKGNPIWISEAARKYDVPQPTLSRWVSSGFINKIGIDKNRILLDERDVAYCSGIYKQYGGKGKRIFSSDGTPYAAGKQENIPIAA